LRKPDHTDRGHLVKKVEEPKKRGPNKNAADDILLCRNWRRWERKFRITDRRHHVVILLYTEHTNVLDCHSEPWTFFDDILNSQNTAHRIYLIITKIYTSLLPIKAVTLKNTFYILISILP